MALDYAAIDTGGDGGTHNTILTRGRDDVI